MLYTFRFTVALTVCLVVSAATAPSTAVSPAQQLFIMKDVMPGLERVGIIWSEDSASGSTLVAQLERASTSFGITIFMAHPTDLADIAPMYRDLVGTHNIQALWIVDPNDTLVNSRNGRNFLIKTATGGGIPVLAPSADWVREGAHIMMHSDGSGVRLVVNKRAADAASLSIPEQYSAQTEFLAAN